MRKLQEDKVTLLNYIQENLLLKQNGYEDVEISKIIFSYGVISGKLSKHQNYINLKETKILHQNYSHYKIPIVNPSSGFASNKLW